MAPSEQRNAILAKWEQDDELLDAKVIDTKEHTRRIKQHHEDLERLSDEMDDILQDYL